MGSGDILEREGQSPGEILGERPAGSWEVLERGGRDRGELAAV